VEGKKDYGMVGMDARRVLAELYKSDALFLCVVEPTEHESSCENLIKPLSGCVEAAHFSDTG
jgi:hypothetical protein